ncbi:MAG: hypothetical protein ACUVRZ_05575 [Desulfobacca sp.]|uniref:hypothetical protein n=1 Tax=Desulfobacca sp. TaxID=2067990 RepID=UPI004049C21B
MVQPRIQLRVIQKRLLYFFLLVAVIGLGAGYYLQSPLYSLVGLLGLGVVIGGVLRTILDRRQLK